MTALKPCPFCGGNARLSYKWNGFRTRTIAPSLEVMEKEGLDTWFSKHITIPIYFYRVQVICNKCHGRGKPIFSKVENYNPYEMPKEEVYKAYEPFIEQAIEAWNRRADGKEEKA